MRLWRLSQFTGLTGEGGLHASGRWHTQGPQATTHLIEAAIEPF